MRTRKMGVLSIACLMFLIQLVSGDYQLSVSIHSYSNPDNKCAACRNYRGEAFGCCDNHAIKDTAQCQITPRPCEILLSLCSRALSTTNVGYQCPQDTSLIYTSNNVLVQNTFSPPMIVQATGGVWEGLQLYIVMNDDDFGFPEQVELVDSFAINLTFPVGTVTDRTTYNGQFGLAQIDLSFNLTCFSNCTPVDVGAIAGGVVAGVALLILLLVVIVVVMVCIKQHMRRGSNSFDHTELQKNPGFTGGDFDNPMYDNEYKLSKQ